MNSREWRSEGGQPRTTLFTATTNEGRTMNSRDWPRSVWDAGIRVVEVETNENEPETSDGVGEARGDQSHSAFTDEANLVLSKDTNSILFIAELTWPWTNFAFWYALLTFIFQEVILLLIILEVFLKAPTYNRLNFPTQVDGMVRVAQGMAIFISLVTQNDLISVIDQVLDTQYNEQMLMGKKIWGFMCKALFFANVSLPAGLHFPFCIIYSNFAIERSS